MSDKIFELEQKIMECWNVVEDINHVYEAVCEQDLTSDEIQNLLLGIKSLYQLKFNSTFNVFEDVCKEYHQARKGNINNPQEGSTND